MLYYRPINDLRLEYTHWRTHEVEATERSSSRFPSGLVIDTLLR